MSDVAKIAVAQAVSNGPSFVVSPKRKKVTKGSRRKRCKEPGADKSALSLKQEYLREQTRRLLITPSCPRERYSRELAKSLPEEFQRLRGMCEAIGLCPDEGTDPEAIANWWVSLWLMPDDYQDELWAMFTEQIRFVHQDLHKVIEEAGKNYGKFAATWIAEWAESKKATILRQADQITKLNTQVKSLARDLAEWGGGGRDQWIPVDVARQLLARINKNGDVVPLSRSRISQLIKEQGLKSRPAPGGGRNIEINFISVLLRKASRSVRPGVTMGLDKICRDLANVQTDAVNFEDVRRQVTRDLADGAYTLPQLANFVEYCRGHPTRPRRPEELREQVALLVHRNAIQRHTGRRK